MKNIHLLGKKILFDKSPLLLDYKPDEKWLDYFEPKSGEWYLEDDHLLGVENGNMGGILFTRECYEKDVMLTFTVSTKLPATRDLLHHGAFQVQPRRRADHDPRHGWTSARIGNDS